MHVGDVFVVWLFKPLTPNGVALAAPAQHRIPHHTQRQRCESAYVRFEAPLTFHWTMELYSLPRATSLFLHLLPAISG